MHAIENTVRYVFWICELLVSIYFPQDGHRSTAAAAASWWPLRKTQKNISSSLQPYTQNQLVHYHFNLTSIF
jgi:hypothetical protein